MMCFPICQFVVLTFCFQMVYSQVYLTPSGNLPIKCGNDLKFKCQYRGTSPCCSSATRSWTREGHQIMNDGAESSSDGKYIETVDPTENYFELTIKNTNKSDAGVKYVCGYGFDTSEKAFSSDDLKCRPCVGCGLECFMFCWFAILCESIIMMEFILIIIWKNSEDSKDEKVNLKLLLIDAVISIVVSMVVSALLGILIGTYTCLCYDNTLPYRLHYIFILLGYAVEVFVLIMLACFNVLKGLTGRDVSVLIVIIILGPLGIIGNAVYILYIFIYIKKKTWKDVDWKDVGIMLSIFITHGIPLFLTCIGWPTKKKAQANSGKEREREAELNGADAAEM